MLLAAPDLPKALWGEAIATSIYLTNRSPIKALPKGKTPHEMLYGTVPLLGRLPIGITSGTGSHEPRTWDIAPSHVQPLRHCPGILPALRAQ
jgi:hypothetical protein